MDAAAPVRIVRERCTHCFCADDRAESCGPVAVARLVRALAGSVAGAAGAGKEAIETLPAPACEELPTPPTVTIMTSTCGCKRLTEHADGHPNTQLDQATVCRSKHRRNPDEWPTSRKHLKAGEREPRPGLVVRCQH